MGFGVNATTGEKSYLGWRHQICSSSMINIWYIHGRGNVFISLSFSVVTAWSVMYAAKFVLKTVNFGWSLRCVKWGSLWNKSTFEKDEYKWEWRLKRRQWGTKCSTSVLTITKIYSVRDASFFSKTAEKLNSVKSMGCFAFQFGLRFRWCNVLRSSSQVVLGSCCGCSTEKESTSRTVDDLAKPHSWSHKWYCGKSAQKTLWMIWCPHERCC